MSEPSLAELAGHDPDAQRQLTVLLDHYRRGGIAGLRAAAEATLLDVPRMPTPREFELVALVREAVLTIAEQQTRSHGTRRDWRDFEVEEERAEVEREGRGGGA